jgi:uncharacterized protein YodC (DUF2158 family)
VAVIDLSSMARMLVLPRTTKEDAMAFEPGDVVFLKSGGPPMTVAAVDDDRVECLWLGDEGKLLRETIPSITLTVGTGEEDTEAEDDEEESEHEDAERAEMDEDEVKPAKKKRKTA